MRDAKTFYEDSYISIKSKTDKELQSLIRSKRDSVDPMSIATRAMCKYELMSRADQKRKEPESKSRPASAANKRKAQSLIQAYNEKRRSEVISKLKDKDPGKVSEIERYEIR